MSKEIVMTEFSECTKRMNDFYDEFINGCKVNNVICNNVNEVNYQLYAGV